MRPCRHIQVRTGPFVSHGDLHITRQATGIVVFVHGSGVTRSDRGNGFVARRLEKARFATLLVDLLDEYETRERHNVFDVDLQAGRLLDVVRWLDGERRTRSLPLGLFGSGVGAGIVLKTAAEARERVRAVVCRSGRPDMALHCLAQVSAPTLFIDEVPAEMPDWPQQAFLAACAEKELVRVPGASPVYREPAALEAVAQHAERWFTRHVPPGAPAGPSRPAAPLRRCAPARERS